MDRINKYIASCGICSRRKAEEYVLAGRVKVNDIIIKDLAYKVKEEDIIKIDDNIINKEERKVYIMLNKPKGYVTTSHEQFGRKSVLDLIDEDVRVYPIGRLDMYTEGLLLLTNDGNFANKLMHPKNKIDKKYIVTSKEKITQNQKELLESGVNIGDYITRPAKVNILDNNDFEIIISEGKNRQVRRMCKAVKVTLTNLKRVQIGNIKLQNLQTGKYRYLSNEEIKSI